MRAKDRVEIRRRRAINRAASRAMRDTGALMVASNDGVSWHAVDCRMVSETEIAVAGKPVTARYFRVSSPPFAK